MVLTGEIREDCSVAGVILCRHFVAEEFFSCLNSLQYQIKPFNELVLVVSKENLGALKEYTYSRLMPKKLRVLEVENGLSDAAMIYRAMSAISSDYVLVVDSRDRVHESLLDLAQGHLNVETDVIIATIGVYTTDGSLHPIKAPLKDQSQSNILRNNISNFFSGKIWRTSFLEEWDEKIILDLHHYDFSPMLLSFAKKIAVIHNKKEPLYFISSECEEVKQGWICQDQPVELLLERDKEIIKEASSEFKNEILCCMIVRACNYFSLRPNDHIVIKEQIRQFYTNLIETDDLDEALNEKTRIRVEKILFEKSLIPNRVLLGTNKDNCAELVNSLEENGFIDEFDVVDFDCSSSKDKKNYIDVYEADKMISILETMEKKGGIFIDESLKCYSSFSAVQKNDAFFCLVGGRNISRLIFGAVPHHPIIMEIKQRLISDPRLSFESVARSLLVGKYGMNLVPRQQQISSGIYVYSSETFLFSVGIYPAVTGIDHLVHGEELSIPYEVYQEKIALVKELKKELSKKDKIANQYREKMEKLAQRNLKIRNSASWRVTEPIRDSLRFIREVKRGKQ